ncbi:MAG: hypothetical protein EDR02_02625 [Actinobacteria bacterium]|nr:MAG: hypothetical protein EDR02_02625 [Actinomycetota bacterium]RIK07597.1 MAG: hypothetical protein DCC48_03635 [Acidobacteriota bacterium]
MKLDERARQASRALMEEVEKTLDVPLALPVEGTKRRLSSFVLPTVGVAVAAAAIALALLMTGSDLEKVETEPVTPAVEGEAPGTLVYDSWADFPGELQPGFLATGASADATSVYVFARNVNEGGDSAIVRYRDAEILVSAPFEATVAHIEAFDDTVLVATSDSDIADSAGTSRLHWLDPVDLSVQRTLDIPGTVSGLTATPDFAFFTTVLTNRIFAVDMHTGETITEIPIDGQVMEMEAGFGGSVMVVTAPSPNERTHGYIDTDTMEYEGWYFCGEYGAACEQSTGEPFPHYLNDDIAYTDGPYAIRDGAVYSLIGEDGATDDAPVFDILPQGSAAQGLVAYSDTTVTDPAALWVLSGGRAYRDDRGGSAVEVAIPQPDCPEAMNGASYWLVAGPDDLWQIDLCADTVSALWSES